MRLLFDPLLKKKIEKRKTHIKLKLSIVGIAQVVQVFKIKLIEPILRFNLIKLWNCKIDLFIKF